MAVTWKVGALPSRVSTNLVDQQAVARNFYQNRFSIVDANIAHLQKQKAQGQISDLEFVNALQSLSGKKDRGGYSEQAKAVTDLQSQAQEAAAKQVYSDYVESQKKNLQNTQNAVDAKFALVQDDFEKNKISRDAYLLQRDAYMEWKKNQASADTFLPKYSYDQFKYGSSLNTYQSGRMRDIERERAIRNEFKKVTGKEINPNQLFELAGSYLPTSYIAKTFQQQKLAKAPIGGLDESFKAREMKYTFPGTGGRAQKPEENYGRRNYYGVR